MNCSSLPDNQTADFIERFFPFTYNQILENDSGCYDFVNHEYVICTGLWRGRCRSQSSSMAMTRSRIFIPY